MITNIKPLSVSNGQRLKPLVEIQKTAATTHTLIASVSVCLRGVLQPEFNKHSPAAWTRRFDPAVWARWPNRQVRHN
jgi:hypothetical protein